MGELFCVFHASEESLVVATRIDGGTSVCDDHAAGRADADVADDCLDCRVCTVERRAYFTVLGDSLCVRHAADAVYPEDDMSAHDMAQAAYDGLRARGVLDAY